MTSSIPEVVLLSIEKEFSTIHFGRLTLEIAVHDKHPKYRITKEISIIPEKKTSGEQKKGD